ncbi:MAG: hypothetical protein QMD50_02985 [Patescibacteria group bacterium]|nr:hypothetical protein [Patescibacteria group bacterium]
MDNQLSFPISDSKFYTLMRIKEAIIPIHAEDLMNSRGEISSLKNNTRINVFTSKKEEGGQFFVGQRQQVTVLSKDSQIRFCVYYI